MSYQRSFALALGLVATLIGSHPAEAYETSTHHIITSHAVSRARIMDTNAQWPILEEIGIADLRQTISPAVVYGVVAEDFVSTPERVARVFNHFYDVQYNSYSGRGLDVFFALVPVRGIASPDWALEDRTEVTAIAVAGNIVQWGGMPQNNSFRHAQQAYYDLLTAQAPAFRQARATEMFRTLGHVVHHIQDMAQPQHTRNEAHKDPPNNYYEGYTEERVNPSIEGILVNNPYPIPELATARAYWYSPQSTSDGLARFLGMAEFTTHNYVSLDTGYRVGLDGVLRGHPAFPWPNAVNPDNNSAKQFVRRTVPLVYADGSSANENAEFIQARIFDALPGVPVKERLVASSSVFDHALRRNTAGRAFTVSDAVFNDNYNILLPRASAFSTGLIDHFFRGRLDIRRNTSGSGWVVENRSRPNQTMNGQVSLWYETTSGLRYPFPGSNTFNVTNLAPGAAVTLAASEPPSSASKVIAAFRGALGSEAADSGYYAVAGKVIPYSDPPVACQGVMRQGGGHPGSSFTYNAGSTVANLPIEFEAYGIPDEIIIRSGSGSGSILGRSKNITGANGVMSGYKLFNIPYNPQTLGSTNVHITVNAPDPDTAWSLVANCPGTEITNNERQYPRVPVEFEIGDFLQGAAFGCQAEMYIDYVRVANISFTAPTRARFRITLTKGEAHAIEFRNYSCQPLTSNVISNVYYRDSAGHTHTTQRMSTTGVYYFDVH